MRAKRVRLYLRRSGFKLALMLLGIAALAGLIYWQRPRVEGGTDTFAGQVGFILLINFTIVLIAVMGILIGRHLVKLVLDRRRNILGSKLRMRLVVAFLGLTLIPTFILFVTASGLITNALEGWFSRQIEDTVDNAVDVARHYREMLEEVTQGQAARIRDGAERLKVGSPDSRVMLDFLEQQRKEYQLFSLRLVNGEKQILLESSHATSEIEEFREPELSQSSLDEAFHSGEAVLFEEREASQFVRGYVRAWIADRAVVLVASNRVRPELSASLNAVRESYREYNELVLLRKPLLSSYPLLLGMITLVLLFGSIWIGLYLAKEISVPILNLAEGTRAVAAGNYDVHIRPKGDDEIATLIRSFNRMTTDLQRTRAEVEKRRLYVETIVSNLAVGVVAFDQNERVTLVNAAAARIFNIADPTRVIGIRVREILKPNFSPDIESLLEVVREDRIGVESQKQIRMVSAGRELQIVCTKGRIVDSQNSWLGTVLLFDDITDLSKAQHMAAWREVARRIAHEIKNPLTPIQLSAQRVKKHFEGGKESQLVTECTDTIVQHVESIKRLADEFSKFARMPTAELTSSDLNYLVSEVLNTYVGRHQEIVFQFIPAQSLPEVMIDREQIRRLLINLIENALSALSDLSAGQVGRGKVTIRTSYEEKRGTVLLEVIDNGPGIPDAIKPRIFEPYYTTREGGTGLGLAVVTSIVTDHQGDIRVYNNEPRGTRFVVEIPLAPASSSQRRFGASAVEVA